ncbi:hypothetical protein BCR44DRAFT_52222 [Catenaria anguillulae PL171]|uniref:Uncharacterized protein n=1 Tax=Catenaria anguillulae PL171 TaxID=765915 RepID=A0A1Y2I458_9FUNG|nr:hypothetical protein BCR44DRAFT_52222 [Catenaria anguillulae PL171]
MIHGSVDPRQSIPLSFLPNSLHAAASGVSHSSASRAGLGAAPLFLDDHLSVSSRLRALKQAARRFLHPPHTKAAQPKMSPVVVPTQVVTVTKASPALVSITAHSIPTPPASPPHSFASIPTLPVSEASPDACDNKQVNDIVAPTQGPLQVEPQATSANDTAYLVTPVTSPKAASMSPSTRRSVSFAAEIVTQIIPAYSHDEYPDRSDPTPPRRLKFAEAAQVMAFQSLMRRQHAMIAVDDEAADFVHEKCPACKGFHPPLSAKMEGWAVPTLEYMEEMGM